MKFHSYIIIRRAGLSLTAVVVVAVVEVEERLAQTAMAEEITLLMEKQRVTALIVILMIKIEMYMMFVLKIFILVQTLMIFLSIDAMLKAILIAKLMLAQMDVKMGRAYKETKKIQSIEIIL